MTFHMAVPQPNPKPAPPKDKPTTRWNPWTNAVEPIEEESE